MGKWMEGKGIGRRKKVKGAKRREGGRVKERR